MVDLLEIIRRLICPKVRCDNWLEGHWRGVIGHSLVKRLDRLTEDELFVLLIDNLYLQK